MDIFEDLTFFYQYFLCMRLGLSRSSLSFSLPNIIINFKFASMKLHTNFENAYWTQGYGSAFISPGSGILGRIPIRIGEKLNLKKKI